MKNSLFETIKIDNGRIYNIEWHNQRCNKSRKVLFNEKVPLNLEKFIEIPEKGLFRCRIVYKNSIESIDYIPYNKKEIKNFKVIESQIDYTHKYNDRSNLEKLLSKDYDEIIIEKNGLLTDTSIANIAFYDGEQWITPKTPLLKGTIREKLLYKNILKLKNIRSSDIINFSHFALMNAMIGFQIQKSINIKF